VRLQDFKSWVNRTGGAPREVVLRDRIRETLGLGNKR
jgi:hypothetical protein